MSLLVTGIRLPFDAPDEEAFAPAMRTCGLHEGRPSLYRRSIDARHGKIQKVCSVLIDGVEGEEAFAEHLQMPSVRYKPSAAFAPVLGKKRLAHRPVVVGLGPAGLFCAYLLARYGYRPLVLERGGDLAERDRAVRRFQKGGELDPACNIQFGEGGAGAYSDGKLTTRTHDPLCEAVLQTLVKNGAPEEILRLAKPHIGTDLLKDVVKAMRTAIVQSGGEVRFRTPLTGVEVRGGRLAAVSADGQAVACERAVLAVGHSARDTFA
ncbi:MAG: NAD(P)-binding protein, partial [Clostridiaceae bacterium]|nr:NAD(P)-binding protein [Clostridiaceae bacterium]